MELINEMAKIGSFNDMSVIVYSDEHNPPHFHFIKKGLYDVRISIEDLEVISYKYQNKGKSMSSQDIDRLLSWLDEKNKKKTLKEFTNHEVLEIMWDIYQE